MSQQSTYSRTIPSWRSSSVNGHTDRRFLLSYTPQLRRLEEFIEELGLNCSAQDVAEFFFGLLTNYFCDQPYNYPWSPLWELLAEHMDELEHSNRGQIVQDIIDEVAEHTRMHFPMFNEFNRYKHVYDVTTFKPGVIIIHMVPP